jgi:hypothetical protein
MVSLLAAGCGGGSSTANKATTTVSPTTTRTVPVVTTTTATTAPTDETTTLPGTTFAPLTTSPTLTPSGASIDRNFIPESSGMDYNFEQSTINGTTYTNALIMAPGQNNGSLQIGAERRYSHFTGSLGIPDSQASESAFTVSISVDGSAPVLSTQVHFGTTTPINLTITNALRIRISVTNIAHCCGTVAIGNPTLS